MSNEVRGFTSVMDALGISWSWSGLCVWLGSEADAYAEELEGFGCRWSVKRGAWYYRYNGGM